MYCPSCLNETLRLNFKGVVDVIINKKQLDNGRFLFNSQTQTDAEIKQMLYKKLKEFFRWYSSFQNAKNISTIEIVSNGFLCSNKCSIEITKKFSVLNILISEHDVYQMAMEIGSEFGFKFLIR